MASLALLGMSGFVTAFLLFFGIIFSLKYLLMLKKRGYFSKYNWSGICSYLFDYLSYVGGCSMEWIQCLCTFSVTCVDKDHVLK